MEVAGAEKRVCVVCETWASGGIESFLCKLLSHMDQTGLQIDVAAAQIQDSVFTQALEEHGVRIQQLSGHKLRWLSNCRRFRALLRENRYDVVHLNAFQGLQLVYLYLAKRAGVPVRIAHSHGSDLRKSPLRGCKLLLHGLGKALFEGAATVRWACSQGAAEFLFRQSGAAQVIPNGIDTRRYRFRPEERERVREELGLGGKLVVGSVGRLERNKNQAFLLEVLERLLARRPECVLLLVGDGSARRELGQRAEELGVAGHVRFCGLSDRVEELLWAMDVFAFPSLLEGLGLAAVEAQAAGLPVVCSEHIPEEADLTPGFRRVPLAEGAGAWAQALLEAEGGPREELADVVRRAGFEISQVSELVRTGYLSE